MPIIDRIVLHRVKLPLTVSYHVSYRVYEDFEPIIAEITDAHGRTGWGEGHISPGHTFETVDGGWAFCTGWAARLAGRPVAEAKAAVTAAIPQSPVAASALVTALEMVDGNPLLDVAEETRLPLVTPFHSTDPADFAAEVDARLAEGFRTLKVKVGKDVETDLAKVRAVQRAVRGRATLRLDANRGFSREDGCRFAAALDPEGIELFEQPCAAKDWEANAAVAAVSTVPLMLDESIYDMDDIERAGAIRGVGFVKLKLKKLGGLERLKAGIERIRALGMTPVLGDGVSSEICCWMEGCVARLTIDNAGEFNGFLKPKARLFATPLRFERGALVLEPGFAPVIDQTVLAAHRIDRAEFSRTAVTAT